jgi:lipoprotein-anchoring transpeptidase ErfK/SrfK
MSCKIVWTATVSLVGLVLAAGTATAQYRGYGYDYDSAPNYYQQGPGGYDPYYGGPQGPAPRGPASYPDDRRASQGYGGGRYRGGYEQDGYGYDQGQPYYPEPQGYGDAGGGDRTIANDMRTMREVENPTRQPPGTIVIDTGSRHLYYVQDGGRALEYGIGVGREGFAWKGTAHVQRKAEWPGWTPPPEMLKRRPDLPRHMDGGIENPLGARAMYLYNGKGDTGFRIHGTNEPDTIGQAVSSGCIRMMNADVVDLYKRVPVGTKVVVL